MTNNWSKCPFCNDELELHPQGKYLMHPINGCIIQHICFEAHNENLRKKWNKRSGLTNALSEIRFEMEDSTDGQYESGLATAMEIVKKECDMLGGGVDD